MQTEDPVNPNEPVLLIATLRKENERDLIFCVTTTREHEPKQLAWFAKLAMMNPEWELADVETHRPRRNDEC